jgi:two-component system nitrogen regulation sensor histidine kinase NtrY
LPAADANTLAFWVGFVVIVLSLISGLSTYLILTGQTSIVPETGVVLGVLLVNVVLMLAASGVIGWQIFGLLRAWCDKVAGARLHVRIVLLFSIIAALPALLLGLAATNSFSRAIDNAFSKRTQEIIANSLLVTQQYLEEHGQVIRNDIANMARDLDAAPASVRADPRQISDLLTGQAGLRDLAVARIIDSKGRILVSGLDSANLGYEPPAPAIFAQANAGQIPVMLPRDSYRVVALARLQSWPDGYLYVARGVSPEVLEHLRRAQSGVQEYQNLYQRRTGFKQAHAAMYFMISMTAVLAAIWTGMWFAGRFVAPIQRLIGAAQQVSRGNLQVRLPEIRGEGDLRRLSRTFNTMTAEIKAQRDELVSANEQLTERRQFMEAVLSGVTAGVLGIDAEGRVTLANAAAVKLLGIPEAELLQKPLADTVPVFSDVIAAAVEDHKPRAPAEAKIMIDGEERTFSVRFTRRGGRTDGAAVVTFDDISELVSAQRTSAWADVARRIAHEIKNPLTPIILNVDRLRRRYGKAIVDDREKFDEITATIERHAGNIKTMVDEFASFARMPKPVMEESDLRAAVRDSVILFRESHPAVTYKTELPADPATSAVDSRLLTQAITNLVKNATEAVEAVEPSSAGADWKPTVDVLLRSGDTHFEIDVIDNGIGLPKQNRSKLLEPYVTTKGSKGTGLGLAIVLKIVEQHGGTLALEDAPPAPGRTRGAQVRVLLPRRHVLSAAAE